MVGVYDNPDGTKTAMASTVPVRFRSVRTGPNAGQVGAWSDLDLGLEETTSGNPAPSDESGSATWGGEERASVEAARHQPRRAPEGFPSFGTSAGYDDIRFGVGLNQFAVRHDGAAKTIGASSGRGVRYRGALAGRDLEEVITPLGFEENVVLGDRSADLSYQLTVVMPAGVTVREGGPGVEFVRGDEVLASIAVGWVYDSSPGPLPNRVPSQVHLARVQGSEAVVEVSADRAFLDDSTTVFPVTIDPTFYTYAAGSWSGADTSVIESFNSQPSPYWSDSVTYVGKVCYGICKQARALMRFDVSSLTALGNAKVLESHVHLVNRDTYRWTGSTLVGSCDPQQVLLYGLGGPFDYNTVDFNKPGTDGYPSTASLPFAWSDGMPGCAYGSSSVIDVDSTPMAKRWIEQGMTNYGLWMQNANEAGPVWPEVLLGRHHRRTHPLHHLQPAAFDRHATCS
jgi:hypothetical protein